ncbi:MAG: (Fe-S)-binding protein [Candidatus Helarchaeota archaeon]|nr:(Fe-S)-binding protein [Candidatus Helarchaeota archaeon]
MTTTEEPTLADKLSELKKLLAFCYQCGTCSGVCTLSYVRPTYSPRGIIYKYLINKEKNIDDLDINEFLDCLTCNLCSVRCPQEVDMAEFMREVRTELYKKGICVEESHEGITSTIARIQTNENVKPKLPHNFFPKGVEILGKGEIVYFPGCLAIFDKLFDDYQTDFKGIAQDSVLILDNLLDQPIAVVPDLKCCGHDNFWKGDFETFEKLAKYNIKRLEEAGAKLVVFSCAEGYRTFKTDYPRFFGDLSFEVKHISEIIQEKEIKFSDAVKKSITYHDPCRLGRFMNVYDQPREILTGQGEEFVKFKEMERIKENAQCCGVPLFANCNDYTKALRLDRLKEAEKTAELLVTSCPKCQLHFNCLLREFKEGPNKINLEVGDLVNVVARLLGLKGGKNE